MWSVRLKDPTNAPVGTILEFEPQRELDLPLVILQHAGDFTGAPVRFFRERCVTWTSVEYAGMEALAAEIGMVEDVEKLRPELQIPTFSQEPQLGVLHHRKVPIPFRRPRQDIPSARAKLADRVRTIR